MDTEEGFTDTTWPVTFRFQTDGEDCSVPEKSRNRFGLSLFIYLHFNLNVRTLSLFIKVSPFISLAMRLAELHLPSCEVSCRLGTLTLV